ncbi:hypothetical protein M430DRAFT_43843 [Amorphotheca resinae ATCC 22711]|uniref:Extracellular membrane protein CFEM domain-containing protein n=1 Tax=Amorphotheca resinae ATCC 22711 TaxID=857342 RepID=A0A2T3AWG9_AMORE|nr:hypothetical protein M430DRAFT_43843 [Amorphotheca resinae ATCC 22711]PSS13027.1 hypothetical protein M430DRAFT_43843 [Amorphotheca resinae ATCC 22711]
MRRKAVFLAALPVTSALSLANFQEITSISIPLTCQLTYDGQIPSCTVSDFENGCSSTCQDSLELVAQSVSGVCSDVNVNPNTLLGIVKSGGILAALCPAPKVTLSTPESSTHAIQQSNTAAHTTISTIPITNPDAHTTTASTHSQSTEQSTVSTSSTIATIATTTTEASTISQTSTSIASASSTSTSTSITSTSISSAATTLSTQTQSAGSNIEPVPVTSTTATSTSSKTSSVTKETSHSDSGGGSPFDISSGSSHISRSLSLLVMAACAGVLLGR